MILNPVVLPLPVALFALALLAYAAMRYTDRWPTYQNQPPLPRHRLGSTRQQFRPRSWDEIAADLPTGPAALSKAYVMLDLPEVTEAEVVEYDPLDHRISLAEVESRMSWPVTDTVMTIPGVTDKGPWMTFEWGTPRELAAA